MTTANHDDAPDYPNYYIEWLRITTILQDLGIQPNIYCSADGSWHQLAYDPDGEPFILTRRRPGRRPKS